MFGICVAVKPTTSYSSRPRKTRLKLWKSRPAAPAINTRVRCMHKSYAVTQDGASPGFVQLTQRFADAVGDRFHLHVRAGDLVQQLVRGRLLAFRPELAQQRARVARREPLVPEALAQVVAQLRLERPRAQVRVDVEAVVDVGEVVRRA